MRMWKRFLGGLALAVGLTPATIYAQLGGPPPGAPAGIPGGPVGAGVPAGPVAAGAPAAPAPANLFSFFCMTPEQKAACRKKICDCMLGKLINNSLAPVGALTGGIIGPFCPPLQAEDLLKPPTSAEGAAAAIMADEMAAKERRAAVRYLGTVDCRYWPEAEMALINALRADRNECVRLEAAISLNRGCCCTKNIIKALALTVASADDDGNPRENSPRVRTLAHRALIRCLNCYAEVVPAPPPPPVKKGGTEGERPGEGPPPGEVPGRETLGARQDSSGMSSRSLAYYARISQEPEAKIVAEAREVVARIRPEPVVVQPEPVQDRSLFGMIKSVWTDDERPEPAAQPVTPATFTQPQRTAPPARVQPATQQAPAPTLTKPAAVGTTGTAGQHPQVTHAHSRTTPSREAVTQVTTHEATPVANVPSTAHDVHKLIQVLHADKEVRHRVWAADMLSAYDGWTNSHIVQALLGSAHRDESPLVRVACLRSLGRMNIRTTSVLTTVEVMHGDPDPNVRAEAQRAHKALTGQQASNTVGLR